MENSINKNEGTGFNRRQLLKTGLALAGGSLLASVADSQITTKEISKSGLSKKNFQTNSLGRRKLGTLEVSSVGLGVQNMSRTYQTTIPTQAEMINIIRTAFDHGVTLFDTAEPTDLLIRNIKASNKNQKKLIKN